MSLDLLGAELVPVGYVAPEKSWVVTPGAIKDEMERVFREGSTLDADVKASNVDSAFKGGWQSFWDGYKKFYDDNAKGVSGWVSRLWGSIGDQTVSYGNQLNDWRSKLKDYGARVTEPEAIEKQYRKDPQKINWKPIVIAVGTLGGLALVGFTTSKIVSAVRIARRGV